MPSPLSSDPESSPPPRREPNTGPPCAGSTIPPVRDLQEWDGERRLRWKFELRLHGRYQRTVMPRRARGHQFLQRGQTQSQR